MPQPFPRQISFSEMLSRTMNYNFEWPNEHITHALQIVNTATTSVWVFFFKNMRKCVPKSA